MQRIRIKFSKGEPVRFISHLDTMHAWERALRRADVALAFSQGFNPHPKMAFATASAVGLISEAEFMDIEVVQKMDLKEVAEKLQQNLPRGIEILEIQEVPLNGPALMAMVDKSEYIITVPLTGTCSQADTNVLIEKVLNSEEVWIEKQGKKGLKKVNIRPGIFILESISQDDSKLQIKTLLQAGDNGNVRPEHLLQALVEAGLHVNKDAVVNRRTNLFFT